MEQPLEGIRVVELATGIAGPYAGRLLADYGAEVVKIEPPGGDPNRRMGMCVGDEPGLEDGPVHLHLNTNKRSIALDIDDAADRDRLRTVLADADVLIESETPGRLNQHGLDHETLAAAQPRLVTVSVTPFGQTGPYAGYKGAEIVHYAHGGPMHSAGLARREPVKMSYDLGLHHCGTMAAMTALSSLALAERDQRSVHVDLATSETQLVSIDRRMTYLLYWAYNQQNALRSPGRRLGTLPNGLYPVRDGHVHLACMPAWVPRMLKTLGDDELAAGYDRPGWEADPELAERLDVALTLWGFERDRYDAMHQAQANGWPLTAVNHPIDVLSDPHFVQTGFWHHVDHPTAGSYRMPGPAIIIDDGWKRRRRPPLLDEHSSEPFEWPERAEPTPPHATSPTPGRPGLSAPPESPPLTGLRVLDLTVVWAGPFATMLLGDLGADIIRVDNPHIFPSATRGLLPRPPAEMVPELGPIFATYPDADPGDRPWNRAGIFTAHARGKRSVTLDLRTELGRETLLRLTEHCDVMIENNAAGLLDKLDLGWDVLHERNPGLTLIRMPSVGLSGPYRDYVGFGVNFEALSGLTAIRGYPDEDRTDVDPLFHMDAASAGLTAFAVHAVLRRVAKTGVGELVELSQTQNMMNQIGAVFIDADRTGRTHGPLGNRDPNRAPQGCYPCAPEASPAGDASASGPPDDDDRWAVISVGDDTEWLGLRMAMGDPPWAKDSRFDTLAGRHEHHDELDGRLAEWTGALSDTEVFERCQSHGVPAAPVLSEQRCYADPHLRARDMFRPNGSEELGTHEYAAHVWHWDGPPLAWGSIPMLGEHNDEVFRDLVGLDDTEMAALDADGQLSRDYLDGDGNPL